MVCKYMCRVGQTKCNLDFVFRFVQHLIHQAFHRQWNELEWAQYSQRRQALRSRSPVRRIAQNPFAAHAPADDVMAATAAIAAVSIQAPAAAADPTAEVANEAAGPAGAVAGPSAGGA